MTEPACLPLQILSHAVPNTSIRSTNVESSSGAAFDHWCEAIGISASVRIEDDPDSHSRRQHE